MGDILQALICLLGHPEIDWIPPETDLEWWEVYLWIHRN